MKIISYLLIITLWTHSVFSNEIYLRGQEDTKQYIKTETLENGNIYFSSCEIDIPYEDYCEPLIKGNSEFTKTEVFSLYYTNRNNVYFASMADVTIMAIAIYFAVIALTSVSAKVLTALGYSLDGGAAGLSGVLFGLPTGIIGGVSMNTIFDNLDPFVHRDLKIAAKGILEMISMSELEDVDVEEYAEGYMLTIEDIDFFQLKGKLISQLLKSQS